MAHSLFKSGFLFFICCGLWSCGGRSSCSVEMKIDRAEHRSLAVFEISAERGSVFIDSIRINSKGIARYSFKNDSLKMYAIAARNGEQIICLLPQPGESLYIEACYDSLLSTATLHDASHPDKLCPNAALLDYQQQLQKAEQEIREIDRQWMHLRYRTANTDSLRHAQVRRIDSIHFSIKQLATRLCYQYTRTLIPVYLANKTIAGKPVFDPMQKQDWNFLQSCALKMQENIPGNSHVERFLFNLARIESYRKQEEIRMCEQNRGIPYYE